MRRDPQRAALVGGRDEPEQQLCSGIVQGREPELVDDVELVAQQVLDDLPDRVVGKPSVEGLDQLRGGEVPDPVTGLDRGDPQRDERVGLPGAGGPDQADVLRSADPLQGREVVEGCRPDR